MSDTTSIRKSRTLALTAAMSVTALCVFVLHNSQNASSFSPLGYAVRQSNLLRGSTTIIGQENAANENSPQGSDSNQIYRSTKELQVVRSSRRTAGRRRLPDIEGFSGQPDPWLFPLLECQGDCDEDEDCDEGLVCFQRDGGESVPGCSGKTDNFVKTDYCIKEDTGVFLEVADDVDIANAEIETTNSQQKRPTGTLNVVGQNGIPAAVYPLGVCQGECDRDSDCAGDLVCYQRQPGQSVPGCQGTEGFNSRGDFCVWQDILNDTWNPTWAPTWSPTFSPTFAVLTENAAVSPTTISTAATTTISPTVSVTYEESADTTSSNTAVETDSPSYLPSMPPSGTVLDANTAFPELRRVGNNGVFAAFPLEKCMGDCDTSDDCADGLICFFRSGAQDVPGCSGVGDYGVDYCIVAPERVSEATSAPSLASSTEATASGTADSSIGATSDGVNNVAVIDPSPLIVMSAFEFEVDSPGSPTENNAESESIRGVVESANEKKASSHESYPVEKDVETPDTVLSAEERKDNGPEERRTDKDDKDDKDDSDDQDEDDDFGDPMLPALALLGADSEFEEFPLDVCQGSCFYDTDCLEGLRCFQRDGYESVPGCKGRGHNSANYCIPNVLNAVDGGLSASNNTPTVLTTLAPSTTETAATTEMGATTIAPSMTETVTETLASSMTETADSSFADSSAEAGDTTLSGSSIVLAALSSTQTPTAVDSEQFLPRPQVVGNNNIFDVYPLTACLGDCDTDDDCMDGLKCLQRQGFEPVPGCDPNFPTRYSADYCVEAKYVPTPDQGKEEETLLDVAEELQTLITSPPSIPPEDGETAAPSTAATLPTTSPSTVMIQASLTVTATPVVIEPTNSPETMAPTFATTMAPTFISAVDPVFIFPTNYPETLSPTVAETLSLANSETIAPTVAETMAPVVDTLAPTFVSEVSPPIDSTTDTNEDEVEHVPGSLSIVFDPLTLLKKCEGDCNSHRDCAEGLFCFHRNGNEMPVPGCVGSAPSVADFCVDIKYMITEDFDAYTEDDADAETEMEKEDEAWEDAIVVFPTPTPSQSPSPSTATRSPSLTWILAAVGKTAAPTNETINPEETTVPSTSVSTEDSQQVTATSTDVPSDLNDTTETLEPSTESTSDATTFSSFVATNNAVVVESAFVATFDPSEQATATIIPTVDASVEGTVDASESGTNTLTEISNVTVSPFDNPSELIIENAADGMTPEPSATDSPTSPSSGDSTSVPSFQNSNATTLSPSNSSSVLTIENTESSITPEPSATDSPTLDASATAFPTSQSSAVIMNASDEPSETEALSQMPYLSMIGNDGTFDSFPLGECEGDCDESADCNPGLVCMQRIENESVPGCQGNAEFSVDYCVKMEYLMTDDLDSLIDKSTAGSDLGS